MGLILPQTVVVTVTHQNINHYKKLGYTMGSNATISVCELPKYSEVNVQVVCDFCDNALAMPWKRYLSLRSNLYCCPSCLSVRKKHIDKDGNLTFIDAYYRSRDWLECEYVTKDRSAVDIANECNINVRTLRWWISHHGLCEKNGSVSRGLPLDCIQTLYTIDKKTTEEIGLLFGVTGNTIASLLKKNGVRLPTRSELLKTYYDEKGGREKATEYARRKENRIKVSCRSRGVHIDDFQGFTTTESHRIRGSTDYDDWRRSVFERDRYTCMCCGKVGGDLNAHHIMNFASYEDGRFDVNNGATLCVECHNPKYPSSFHRIYGEKNNTREQLDMYILNRRAELSA